MKGLLKKDLVLLLNTGKSYVAVILIGIVIGRINEGMRNFSTSFAVIMLSMAGLSTLSYDDFDNGLPFLMTLSPTRKTYIREKYLLCFLAGMAGCVLSVVIHILVFGGAVFQDGENLLLNNLLFFATAGTLFSLMIPARLKFGPEKYRVVSMGVLLVSWVVAFGGVALLKALSINPEQLLKALGRLPEAAFLAAVLAVCGAVATASYLCSLHILEKKQF